MINKLLVIPRKAGRLPKGCEWEYESPEDKKARELEYYRAYRERYPERTLWRAAKYRAKTRGLDFDISYEDVVIPEFCPILGIKIVPKCGHGNPGGAMDSPSLDRIDNNLGYVKGNIQVISHKANSMKFTATPEELLKFAEWIKETYD